MVRIHCKWKSWYHKPSGREHRETTAGSRSKAGTGRTLRGLRTLAEARINVTDSYALLPGSDRALWHQYRDDETQYVEDLIYEVQVR